MLKIFCEMKESLNNICKKLDNLRNEVQKERNESSLSHDEIIKAELKKDKAVEYYASTINGWINMRMEITKTLVILSTGGIGVLLTFFKDIPKENIMIFYMYIVSFLFFVLSVSLAIIVYYKNSDFFAWILNSREGKKPNPKIYMNLAIGTFIFSVLLSFYVAIELKDLKESDIKEKYISSLEYKIKQFEDKNKELSIELDKNRKVLLELDSIKKDIKTINEKIEKQKIFKNDLQNNMNNSIKKENDIAKKESGYN